jgi:hypothetical protein
VIMDGLYTNATDRSLTPTNKALFENACARASKSLWIVHTNCGV